MLLWVPLGSAAVGPLQEPETERKGIIPQELKLLSARYCCYSPFGIQAGICILHSHSKTQPRHLHVLHQYSSTGLENPLGWIFSVHSPTHLELTQAAADTAPKRQ